MLDQDNPSADQPSGTSGSGDGGNTVPGQPTEPVVRRRRRRVREHLEEGLNNPSALEAILSCVVSDLTVVELNLAQGIIKNTRGHPMSLEDIDEQSPAIGLLTRVVKQIVQVQQLVLQLSSARSDRQGRKDESLPSEEI